jgi:uncharacterized membrane protein YecN with MAPEG domain
MGWVLLLLVATTLGALGWAVHTLSWLLVVAAVLLAIGLVNGWEKWRA